MQLQEWLLAHVVTPQEVFTVLDVGTEYGHSAERIKRVFHAAKITGVEVHEPTRRACLDLRGDCYVSIQPHDAIAYMRELRDGAFDVVLAAEVVEHQGKEAGRSLLEHAERVASRLAIVTSPIGFQEHGELDGNPHQRHLSGWTPEELEGLGWRTFATMPTGYGLFVSFVDKTGRV